MCAQDSITLYIGRAVSFMSFKTFYCKFLHDKMFSWLHNCLKNEKLYIPVTMVTHKMISLVLHNMHFVKCSHVENLETRRLIISLVLCDS